MLREAYLITKEKGETHHKHTQDGGYDETTDPDIYLVGKVGSVPKIKEFLEKQKDEGKIDIENIDAFMIENIKMKDKKGEIKDIKNALQAYNSRIKLLQKLTNA